MVGTKPCTSLVAAHSHLTAKEVLLDNPTDFRSLVGALHYLTWIRPKIAFTMSHVCQHMSHPTTLHLLEAKRFLRYLKGTINHGLCFTKGPSS